MRIETRPRSSRWRSWLPCLLLLAAGCADPNDELSEQSLKLTGGTRERGTPNVVLLLSWESSNPVGTLGTCTAELVAPDVLLTAAHCLQKRGNYAAYLGDDGKDLGTPIDPGKSAVRARLRMARAVHAHPQYVTTQGYYDVGVVLLQEEIVGVPLLPILRSTPTAAMLRNVSIVGYGKTFDGDASFAVTKYRADGLSASLDATHTMTVGDAVRHACVGDSGGPVLADIDGVSTILGTDSYSDETGGPNRCRRPSYYQRVDLYLSFLDRYIPRVTPGTTGGGDADASIDAGPGGSPGDDAGPDAADEDAGDDAGSTYDAGTAVDAGGTSWMGDNVADAASADSGVQFDAGAWEPEADGDGCSISARRSRSAADSAFGLLALALFLAWRRGSRLQPNQIIRAAGLLLRRAAPRYPAHRAVHLRSRPGTDAGCAPAPDEAPPSVDRPT